MNILLNMLLAIGIIILGLLGLLFIVILVVMIIVVIRGSIKSTNELKENK